MSNEKFSPQANIEFLKRSLFFSQKKKRISYRFDKTFEQAIATDADGTDKDEHFTAKGRHTGH